MFTRLLVGYSGSAGSRAALKQAIVIGRMFHSTIVVARWRTPERHLALTSGGSTPDRWDAHTPEFENRAAGTAALADAVELVTQAGLVGETLTTRAPLHRLALEVDIVCVGRGMANRPGDGLGATTTDIIAQSPVPVLVCGRRVSRFDRCAVAVGEGDADQRALALAARFADVTGAHLELLLASPDQRQGENILALASSLLSEPPVHFTVTHEQGRYHETLAAAISRLNCNGLFVGGRRRDRRLAVPTHSEAIFRATDIPVLVHN